jgi:hypothetical protein
MTDHPITPPLELVDSIWNQFKTGPTRNLLTSEAFREAITKASQWGADQELEACVDFVQYEADWNTAEKLRAARRPKPPSLKELALALVNSNKPYLDDTAMDTIRRALEQLNG